MDAIWCIEDRAAIGAQSTHPSPPVCVQVYARAVRLVPKAERMAVYDLYLAKASEFFGIGKVRQAAGFGWCVGGGRGRGKRRGRGRRK